MACVSRTPGQAGSSQQEIEFFKRKTDFSRIFFESIPTVVCIDFQVRIDDLIQNPSII